jgi:hypothetical protein
MGFGKERNKIRLKVLDWKCEGNFGYGHGRAVAEFGPEYLKGRSVCNDICQRKAECRATHHTRMDTRYPNTSEAVRVAVQEAHREKQPILTSVILMMRAALSENMPEAVAIKAGLEKFGVNDMTDHYVYGQLENVQRGLNKEKNDVE